MGGSQYLTLPSGRGSPCSGVYCPPHDSHNAQKGEVPQGYSEIKVGGIVASTNNMPKIGTEWHSDGSKVTVEDPEPQDKAGTALKCGPLRVIARVQGPQTSYQAELQGALLFAHMSDEADTLALDNQAVVDYGSTWPHREPSDVDYRLQLADVVQKKKSTSCPCCLPRGALLHGRGPNGEWEIRETKLKSP